MRSQVTKVADFGKILNRVLDFRSQTSSAFFKLLEKKITFLKPVVNIDSNTQAEQLLKHMQVSLANQYDAQSDTFKAIVRRDNRLAPFFISISQNNSTDLAPSLV